MSLQQGKVALITGAASGIGLAIAIELLRNDAEAVVLTDINEEQGQKALKELHEEFDSSRVIYVKLDTTNEEEFRDAFKTTISTYGNVDIVVNNAGIMSEKDYVKVINVNLLGKLRGTILALEYMTPGGIVLNMSSLSALCTEFSPVYSTSKSGVLAFSLNYGKELYYDKTQIKVITLCPGYTETGLMEKYKPENDYMTQTMETLFTLFPKQNAETVAKAAIHVLSNAPSGTAWGVNNGKMFKINMPEWIEICEFVDDNV